MAQSPLSNSVEGTIRDPTPRQSGRATSRVVTYPRNLPRCDFPSKPGRSAIFSQNNPYSFKLIVRCETIFSGRVIDKIMAEVTKQHNPLLEIIHQRRNNSKHIKLARNHFTSNHNHKQKLYSLTNNYFGINQLVIFKFEQIIF